VCGCVCVWVCVGVFVCGCVYVCMCARARARVFCACVCVCVREFVRVCRVESARMRAPGCIRQDVPACVRVHVYARVCTWSSWCEHVPCADLSHVGVSRGHASLAVAALELLEAGGHPTRWGHLCLVRARAVAGDVGGAYAIAREVLMLGEGGTGVPRGTWDAVAAAAAARGGAGRAVRDA
jgi:hypothetical protein